MKDMAIAMFQSDHGEAKAGHGGTMECMTP